MTDHKIEINGSTWSVVCTHPTGDPAWRTIDPTTEEVIDDGCWVTTWPDHEWYRDLCQSLTEPVALAYVEIQSGSGENAFDFLRISEDLEDVAGYDHVLEIAPDGMQLRCLHDDTEFMVDGVCITASDDGEVDNALHRCTEATTSVSIGTVDIDFYSPEDGPAIGGLHPAVEWVDHNYTTEDLQRVRHSFDTFTSGHKLHVRFDNGGPYRDLYVGKPGWCIDDWSITTWPGHLAMSGDYGTFVFAKPVDDFLGQDVPNPIENADSWSSRLVAGGPTSVVSARKVRLLRLQSPDRMADNEAWSDAIEMADEFDGSTNIDYIFAALDRAGVIDLEKSSFTRFGDHYLWALCAIEMTLDTYAPPVPAGAMYAHVIQTNGWSCSISCRHANVAPWTSPDGEWEGCWVQTFEDTDWGEELERFLFDNELPPVHLANVHVCSDGSGDYIHSGTVNTRVTADVDHQLMTNGHAWWLKCLHDPSDQAWVTDGPCKSRREENVDLEWGESAHSSVLADRDVPMGYVGIEYNSSNESPEFTSFKHLAGRLDAPIE